MLGAVFEHQLGLRAVFADDVMITKCERPIAAQGVRVFRSCSICRRQTGADLGGGGWTPTVCCWRQPLIAAGTPLERREKVFRRTFLAFLLFRSFPLLFSHASSLQWPP